MSRKFIVCATAIVSNKKCPLKALQRTTPKLYFHKQRVNACDCIESFFTPWNKYVSHFYPLSLPPSIFSISHFYPWIKKTHEINWRERRKNYLFIWYIFHTTELFRVKVYFSRFISNEIFNEYLISCNYTLK